MTTRRVVGGTVGRMLREAAAGDYPDPDRRYDAGESFAFEAPDAIRDLVAALSLSDLDPGPEGAPIPLLLRLHAEGRGPRDLAASIVQAARIGFREWLGDPERDSRDPWCVERKETVGGYLDRYADRDTVFDEEVARTLAGAGYAWHAFDADIGAGVSGVLDVGLLDRIEAEGFHLGHVARCIAEDRDVEPHGLVGSTPGWGTIAYEGAGVYRLTLENDDGGDADFDLRTLDGRSVYLRLKVIGRRGGDLLFRAEPGPAAGS